MIIALLVIVAGIYCIIKTEKVGRITGEIPFAEKIIGAGGTYLFIKLIGLLMIIVTALWMTGTLQSLLYAVFSPFLFVPKG